MLLVYRLSFEVTGFPVPVASKKKKKKKTLLLHDKESLHATLFN